MEREDIELLRDYVANKAEPAFRALVERHVDMVYATALRQVNDPHLAEEATQAVFIALARKAPGLSSATILAGWLFRAAQFAGAKVQRTEARRKHWEQQAAQMQPTASDGESAWDEIAPHLNDALNQLREPERHVILLRFLESKSIAEVGSVLGTSESATKMRIARALEQLREIFRTRGVVLPAALLLSALSTQATSAAPAGLSTAIVTSALLKASTTTLLTKGTILLMTTSKSKIAVAAIVILLLCSSTTAWLTYRYAHHRNAAAAAAAKTSPAEAELTFSAEAAPGEPAYVPERGGRLRIVTADGDVFTTNGRSLVVVDSNGTNTITLRPGDGGRRPARRTRMAGAGGAPGAGFGVSPADPNLAPAPAPQ